MFELESVKNRNWTFFFFGQIMMNLYQKNLICQSIEKIGGSQA